MMWCEFRVSVGNHRHTSAIALALGFRRDEWIIASPLRFLSPASHLMFNR